VKHKKENIPELDTNSLRVGTGEVTLHPVKKEM
jgi:hypothetical protein